MLPIRGEKRLIPVELDQTGIDPELLAGAGLGGGVTSVGEISAISSVQKTLTDYVTIRLLNKDKENYVYRFLINPKTISVAHQTLDSHSLTRAGWQFGIWGEDTIDLHLTGTTVGQYHLNGLTDIFEEYTISYRNIMELMNLFENNGYTFEGDALNAGDVFAADFTRRRIKYHQDVELRVGNFIWRGMFTSMNFNSSADTPFYNKFDIGFLAWKESYRSESPWRSPIQNSVYRGHAKEVAEIDLIALSQQSKESYSRQDAINKISNTEFTPSTLGNGFSGGINPAGFIVDPPPSLFL